MNDYSKRPGGKPHFSDYDLYLGGNTKTADLTIYYNVALDNIDKVKNRNDTFLAEYLWKASLQKKNPNGYIVTGNDKNIIKKLIKKVDEIRNYHSHLWHDNEVLAFDNDLKEFVEAKYEDAKAALFEEFPSALTDYEYLVDALNKKKDDKFKLFKWVKDKGKHYITEEGRVFFLSFFLTTGQMRQFLQQRQGSKRTDTPLYKIKHLLYSYYCHRDGASVGGFHQEDRFIDNLTEAERQNIFKARTAYKLMAYLFDYPDYWGSQQEMPLFDEQGNIIKNVEQLKDYIERDKLLPGLTFKLLERKRVNVEDEKEAKILEDKYRTGTIAFTCDEAAGYDFHIDFEALHRLVVFQIIGSADSKSPLSILISQLKRLTQNRANLYRILSTSAPKRTEEDEAYLSDRQNQYLRGGRKLTDAATAFFEGLEKEKDEKPKERILLLNYIRGKNDNWINVPIEKGDEIAPFEPEHIQVHKQDYVTGTEQKFRAGNRFVYYAAKFLMDFGGDNWYWGMEKFAMGKKPENADTESLLKHKVYFKASEIPLNEDYRLTIESGHVYMALLRDGNKHQNHEKYWQFAIGPNAMCYLAAYIVNNETRYVHELGLFLQYLTEDLGTLNQKSYFDETDKYRLLEKPFVERYLQQVKGDFSKLEQLVISRIAHIQHEWANALENKQYLSRSEKNRIIMNAYRFFDWTEGGETEGGKFLRANEYNQLSVCHYSLHLKKDRELFGKKTVKGKYNHLFYDLFELDGRRPPIPKEIQTLLTEANSLDELLELVTGNRSDYLQAKIENYQSLPTQLQKKELPLMCRTLGISIPASLLKEKEQNELKQKHKKTLQVQPFAIHPMLVVKYFFAKEYTIRRELKPAVNKKGEQISKREPLTIFSDLRKNQLLTKALHSGFYKEQIATSLYPEDRQKKQREKLTGLMAGTYTEDILLWWMALRYLNNEYTKPLADLLARREKGVQFENYGIGSLNNLPIGLPLKNEDTEDTLADDLYVNVLVHQLDDLMFMEQRSRLRKAAVHFKKRCTDERELWGDELKKMSANQFGGKPLPTGTKADPIPFQTLREEMELVRRTGQKLAGYMLAFEKDVLNNAVEKKHDNNKNNFHQWLKDNCGKRPADKFHFNFEKILTLAAGFENIDGKTKNLLSDYRNITFHNDVPVIAGGSFAWLTRGGQTINNVLKITEDLTAKKDRSVYGPGGEKYIPKN